MHKDRLVNCRSMGPSFRETWTRGHHRASLTVLLAALALLLLAWGAVLAVDVYELSRWGAEKGMWWHLFRNRGPVEWLQWLFIALIFWHGAYLCGRYQNQDRVLYAKFWGWSSVTFILMLVEDAGDPRHIAAEYGAALMGVPERYIEGLVFALILLPLLWALWRYNQPLRDNPQVWPYAGLGVIFYGIAATASLVRVVDYFYDRIGTPLSQLVTGGAVPAFYFMDFAVEETLEVLGGAFLLAAVLLYLRTARVRPGSEEPAE